MSPAVVGAASLCAVPGMPALACAIGDTLTGALVGGPTGAVGGAVGGALGSLAAPMFTAIAEAFFNSWWLMQAKVLTLWVHSPTPTPADLLAPGSTRGWVAWLTQLVLIVSVLLAAGRTILTRDGRNLAEAGRTVVLTLLASALAVSVAAALVRAGDAIANTLLDDALIEGFTADPQPAAAGLATVGGPSGMLLLGLAGFLVSAVQAFLLLGRNAILPVVIVLLPLAAAAGGAQLGRAWFARLASWLLALALYKPIAAVVYAVTLVQARTADSAVTVLTAMTGMVLAVLTLPALLKLLSPATAGGGGGGGSLYGAGMVAGEAARQAVRRG